MGNCPFPNFKNQQSQGKLVRLFGGADRRNYYRQDVAGRPDGPPPPQNAARMPMARSGNAYQDSDSEDSAEREYTRFTNTKIRHAFIRKVYIILACLLGYTAAVIALFLFEPNCNDFATDYNYVGLIFLGVSLIFYLVLVCSQKCRRSTPGNFILLCIYTVLSSIGFGCIAANYSPELVLYSFLITAAVCLLITLLAMQKWIDITGWGMYLCIIGMVVSLLGMVTMIMMFVMGWNDTTRILYLVYASIVALVGCLYFMYMTQLILGGKKYELSPEDYILGVVILYTDIMQLFITILSIFGAANG